MLVVDNALLEKVLNVNKGQIERRQELYAQSADKMLEKVQYLDSQMHKTVLIKYGTAKILAKEMMIYNCILNQSGEMSPRLVGCGSSENGTHILALEWIEGTYPDFQTEAVVKKVFSELGAWAAYWSIRWNKMQDGLDSGLFNTSDGKWREYYQCMLQAVTTKNTILRFFKDLAAMAGKVEPFVLAVGGEYLRTFFQGLLGICGEELAEFLGRMPITLDPGNISKHNFILSTEDGGAYLTNFENAAFRPMILLLERLSEGYGAIPSGSLVDIALEAYWQAWNQTHPLHIAWDDFYCSYCFSVIYSKCRNFYNWMEKIGSNKDVEVVTNWARQGAVELKEMLKHVHTYQRYVYHKSGHVKFETLL